MALTYIKKYNVERLKLAIQAAQHDHGTPLPLTQVVILAAEFAVQNERVRRIERRTDIDLAGYAEYRRQMKVAGVDPDISAGSRICVGGKATAKHKGKAIRDELLRLIESGEGIVFSDIAVEFGLHEKSNWPRSLYSEIQKKAAGGEKRPVSPEQRELIFDLLRSMGGRFGLPNETSRHKEAVDQLLDKYSLAQIHKAIKSIYYLQKAQKAMRSSFAQKVIRPLLSAIDFELFLR